MKGTLRGAPDNLELLEQALETDVEQQEREDYTELLDLHTEANQFEFELGRLESDRDDVDT